MQSKSLSATKKILNITYSSANKPQSAFIVPVFFLHSDAQACFPIADHRYHRPPYSVYLTHAAQAFAFHYPSEPPALMSAHLCNLDWIFTRLFKLTSLIQ